MMILSSALLVFVPILLVGGALTDSSFALSCGTVIATLAVGSHSRGIVYDPSNRDIYVANEGFNTLSAIDGVTNTVLSNTVPAGCLPDGVAATIRFRPDWRTIPARNLF